MYSFLVFFVSTVSAAVFNETNCSNEQEQCDSDGFKGPSCCNQGSTCVEYNQTYSSCIANPINQTEAFKSNHVAGTCGFNRVKWSLNMQQPFNSNNEWRFDTGNYNGEKQIYVPQGEAGQYIRMENGKLLVMAIRDNSNRWKAARAVLKHGWGVNYRAEATFQLDQAVDGAFPAIWMLPPSGKWPLVGEIDIFEYQSEFLGTPTPQTLHFGERYGGNALSFKQCPINPTASNTLAVESTANYIRFFCNGQLNGQYNKPANPSQYNWPYGGSNSFAFILNYAIEPSFAQRKVPNNIRSLKMIIPSLVVRECL
ncbi:hypothetical protein HDV02_000940 [Globomyces sp. JEL0801]|nr:hypothetical protein HDV02_000940 [Globomyces sp. JEL0801]